MALITTIGGATADSYATLAEYQARASSMGWTLSGVDATDEVNLRRSAAYLDGAYEFVGVRQYQAQAMEWPRTYTGLVRGFVVEPDTIPQAVKNAQMEMAYLIQGGSDPFATLDGVVGRTRDKAGPVETETEYLGGKGVPRYRAVDTFLRDYLAMGGGQVALLRA